MMCNKALPTVYTGVTNNLERRVFEHKLGEGSKFTTKYRLSILIYFEEYESINEAIARAKQLKNWHREWKWSLIKSENPELKDLSEDWYEKLDPEINSG